MKKVAIVNYGMGNLDSVVRAIKECGGEPVITCQVQDFEAANYIILPGVGSFATGMFNIRALHLDEILWEQVVVKQIPFLGICLGMQLLATKGWEGGESEGLGWIEGEVIRFRPDTADVRIPHMGWNEVVFTQSSPLFTGVQSAMDFYFVHSYHLEFYRSQDVLAYTPYCGRFVSVVGQNSIFGVQFHPEKSQRLGFQVLKNFLAL